MAEAKIKHEVVIVRHKSSDLNFKSKAEAFDHFFASYLNAGLDDVEAAEKAEKVCKVISKAKNLPDTSAEGIEKAMEGINKIVAASQQHPKIVEFLAGLASGFVGGRAVAESGSSDFDESKSIINLDDIP